MRKSGGLGYPRILVFFVSFYIIKSSSSFISLSSFVIFFSGFDPVHTKKRDNNRWSERVGKPNHHYHQHRHHYKQHHHHHNSTCLNSYSYYSSIFFLLFLLFLPFLPCVLPPATGRSGTSTASPSENFRAGCLTGFTSSSSSSMSNSSLS